jgi:hypothetical protein
MKYDVHAYVIVRIKVRGVEADSQIAAIDKVETQLDPGVHCNGDIGVDVADLGHVEYAEYADDIREFNVDEQGDAEFARSMFYEWKDGGWVGRK